MLLLTEAEILALTALRDVKYSHTPDARRPSLDALVWIPVNRAKASGTSVKDACTEVGAFKMWTRDDPKHCMTLAARSNRLPVWTEALDAATRAIAGTSIDPTGGAIAYHDCEVSEGADEALHTPSWAEGRRAVYRTGTHAFYRF